jgi:hypothetical protein
MYDYRNMNDASDLYYVFENGFNSRETYIVENLTIQQSKLVCEELNKLRILTVQYTDLLDKIYSNIRK